MLDFINIAKALSDKNRIRALMMLFSGELCVCQIIEMLSLAPSTVSKHMSILRQAKLVQTRKQGRWMFYRPANGKDSPKQVVQAIRWLKNNLADDKQICEDAKQLRRVCRIDKEELCARYKKIKPKKSTTRNRK